MPQAHEKPFGLALRSTVFGPTLAARIVPLLDGSKASSVWFPSVSKNFDSLDLCGVSLGRSDRILVGTGVIRPSDYEYSTLLARLHTLAELSAGRFVLGLGTGGGVGREALDSLVGYARKLKADYPEQSKPPIFLATLKKRALRAAYENADGAILNFCPPDYVRRIIPGGVSPRQNFVLACYIKLFFAEKDETARKMLVDEIRSYSRLPQYRAMFDEAGVSGSIDGLDSSGKHIPEDVLEISLANPSDAEVVRFMRRFADAGVDLPILYPYVSGSDAFKAEVVQRLAALT
jgi:alkanesulfonate monooxygenase SsuD/methylene tetrahydromethanopterin reductase-like flavin-dependent oxidoreductase (luciferase family)